jgi:GTP-binding protein EngB required for normal cell division
MRDTGHTGTTFAVGTHLDRLAAIAGELGDHDLAGEADAERRRLGEARFFAACVGQFKRGKSTLINAIVGEAVLPVGVIPVTSVVTILSYGDAPTATVQLTNGQSRAITLDTIADFVDERRNPRNTRGAVVVDVAFPSDILREGLCLVDTPGLGSVHATNTEATRAFVPRIDVALIVVGPDPPISGAELAVVQEASGEAGELAVILNKADQVSPDHLREVADFTRSTMASAIHRPVEHFYAISALERLTAGTPTRDWEALESYLRQLSMTARERLVGHAGARAVARFARRIANELMLREDALRRPLVEIEQRVARLRQALVDLDQTLIELRFRFDAAEADLGAQFEQWRTHFSESTGALHQTLLAWTDARATAGRSLRPQAFEEARRLATSAVQQWLDTMDPVANRLYHATTERFVRAANDYIGRVAADAADLDAEELPAEIEFRARRQFYFTHLMHTTGGTPIMWLIDRCAPRSMRRAHVARAASAYLAHLLESNSHRVENDFRDRTRESRRWLEAQIRARLAAALRSAERAMTVAVDKQHISEAAVAATLHRIEELRTEVLTMI